MADKTLGITLQPDQGSIAKMASTVLSNIKSLGSMAAGAMGGNVAGALGAAGGMVGNLAGGPVGGAIGGMVAGIPQMLMDITTKMASFVEVFNPAAAKEFFRVFDDISGVMGMLFLPTIQVATKYLRSLADLFYGATGPLQHYFEGYASVYQALLPAFQSFLDIILEVNKPMMAFYDMLLNAVIPVLRKMANTVSEVMKIFNSYMGIGKNRKDTFGMGGLDAGFTSLEGYGKQAATSFARMSLAGKNKRDNAAEDSANYLEQIKDILGNVKKRADDITQLFIDIGTIINQGIKVIPWQR